MKNKYIVLRDLSPTRYNRVHEQLASASVDELQEIVRFRGSLKEPPIPRIDIVEAEPRHAAELRRDERAVAIALEMPVSPIEQVRADTQKRDEGPGPTWGINALGAHDCRFKGNERRLPDQDSGIRKDHAALMASDLKIADKDFTGQNDITDESGHGTHCAAQF